MQSFRSRSTVPFLATVVLGLAALVVSTTPVAAQVGSCVSPTVDAYLDVGNVRSRILANGNQVWARDPYVYEVPKGEGVNALFAGGFWIGGMVGGELRVAAARYGNYEFWTGPIDDNGNPPDDCSEYERIWNVYRSDIEAYDRGESPATDLAEWPTGLGAPTLAPAEGDGIDNDHDGTVDESGEMKRIHEEILEQPLSQRVDRVIDLEAGERPELIGDQMLWWIMNDNGNEHGETETPPIGLEVHASAFAFDMPGDVGNTTFYRRKLILRSDEAFEEAYVAQFYDPDLGDFQDDYVGCDTTLGMAFTYNADNHDGWGGYGIAPPAVGYDFLQGPVVSSPGDSAVISGRVLRDHRMLGMTSHVYYNSGGGLNEDPSRASDYYNYFQGRWKDGRPIREFGDGFNINFNDPEIPATPFMYAGDPVTFSFWSEMNSDGTGQRHHPADRRHLMSSGPFRMEPGDVQDIVYAIVWARGGSHLDSVTELRDADRRIQAFADNGYRLPAPPDPPNVTFTPLDGAVAIEWSNAVESNNYLDGYRVHDPLADPDYPWVEFEGYEVWRFRNAQDSTGTLLAVYDKENGITEVEQDVDLDGFLDRTTYGTDAGIRHSHLVTDLDNYRSYHFGIRAYAYAAGSVPEIKYSEMVRRAVVPTRSAAVVSDVAAEAAEGREDLDIVATRTVGVGDGIVGVDVVNPAAVVDADYRVEFYTVPAKTPIRSPSASMDGDSEVDAIPPAFQRHAKTPGGPTTFDVLRDDTKIFDGSIGGVPAPQRQDLFVADGLEFTILSNEETPIRNFLVTSNAAGALSPPDQGAFAMDSTGFPEWEGGPDPEVTDRPTRGYQQATTNAVWGMNVGGGDGSFEGSGLSFMSRSLRGDNLTRLGPFDYEMRFTAEGGFALRYFEDNVVVQVPFELWRTGIGTPDDQSDDVRMIPFICENACGHDGAPVSYDIGGDHAVSDGADDPFTDWVYWYLPVDESAGSTGYDAFAGGNSHGAEYDDPALSTVCCEVMGRTVLVNLDAGPEPPYDPPLPEEGTVFRIVTSKPFQPGDVFEFSTAGFGATEPDSETQRDRLAEIGIVPNPYMAYSDYEVDLASDEVRFTGLPDVATIRVFTLHGTLVRTVEKDSPGLRSLSWDVRNEDGRKLASGMYLIHVDVPGVGERVIKFGMVKDGVVE